MEDTEMIELYWARNEDAIRQTDKAYGRKLYGLADRILRSREDSEESVSDTYMKAWDTIPPQKPTFFFAYLARICRNAALGKLEWKNAAKRNAELVTLTKEMEQCLPDRTHDRKQDAKELGCIINRFLSTISRESRMIFLRRYWYTDSIEEIADRYQLSQSKVKTQLHRTRIKLRLFLEKEGISV